MPKRTSAAITVAGLTLAGLTAALPVSASAATTPAHATTKTGTLRLLISAKKGSTEKGGTYVVDKTVDKKTVKVASGSFTFGKAASVKLAAGTYALVITTTKSKTTDKGVKVNAGKVHTVKATVA